MLQHQVAGYAFSALPLLFKSIFSSGPANIFQPALPTWLTSGLEELHKQYPDVLTEGMMRHAAVSAATGLLCAEPPADQPTPEGIKYKYFPRIRCYDCPRRLYMPGPDKTVGRFEIHLKNGQHSERLAGRIAADRARRSFGLNSEED